MIDLLVERLTALLGPLTAMSRDRREVRDNALRAISHALRETLIYYASLGRGLQRDVEREEQLSRYWAAAAIPIRHIDQELAVLCEHKSDYWVNPERWDEAELIRTGIRLEDLKKRYQRLLTPRAYDWRNRREK